MSSGGTFKCAWCGLTSQDCRIIVESETCGPPPATPNSVPEPSRPASERKPLVIDIPTSGQGVDWPLADEVWQILCDMKADNKLSAHGRIMKAIFTHSAPIAAREEREPVAWMVELADGDSDVLVFESAAQHIAKRHIGSRVRPLYLHPLPAPTPIGEPGDTAWLIERGQPEGQSPTCWWAGEDEFGRGLGEWGGWTPDANKAIRYRTEIAAEEIIERKHTNGLGKASCRAVQHGWIPRAPIGETGGEEALEALAFLEQLARVTCEDEVDHGLVSRRYNVIRAALASLQEPAK